MLAPRVRRPTIRKVRDWDPALRAPRVPLELVPRVHASARETVPMFPHALDEETPLVPLKSDIHAIVYEEDLDGLEETLAYVREIRERQQTIGDPDSALEALLQVYEGRAKQLERERAAAVELATRRQIEAEDAKDAAALKRPATLRERLAPHTWKIVYGAICVWGLVQLAITR